SHCLCLVKSFVWFGTITVRWSCDRISCTSRYYCYPTQWGLGTLMIEYWLLLRSLIRNIIS
ncbi:hypothetical protein, partial [Nostoc sp.]|uniref:hypothetical protein n=1 Tax=Nostoc sp. TaxID=1180 RepID=UPI002FF96A6E